MKTFSLCKYPVSIQNQQTWYFSSHIYILYGRYIQNTRWKHLLLRYIPNLGPRVCYAIEKIGNYITYVCVK